MQIRVELRDDFADEHRPVEDEPSIEIAFEGEIVGVLNIAGFIVLEPRPRCFKGFDLLAQLTHPAMGIRKIGFERLQFEIVKWSRNAASGAQDVIAHENAQRQAVQGDAIQRLAAGLSVGV